MGDFTQQQGSGEHEGSQTAVAAAPEGHVPDSDLSPASSGPRNRETQVGGRPNLEHCPRCNIGLLYPITWDEDAVHESGQPLFHPRQKSGGSVLRHCFHCDYGDSVALAPSEAPADPRQW